MLLVSGRVVRFRVPEAAAMKRIGHLGLLQHGKDERIIVLHLHVAQLMEPHGGQLSQSGARQVELDQVLQVGESVPMDGGELSVSAERAEVCVAFSRSCRSLKKGGGERGGKRPFRLESQSELDTFREGPEMSDRRLLTGCRSRSH